MPDTKVISNTIQQYSTCLKNPDGVWLQINTTSGPWLVWLIHRVWLLQRGAAADDGGGGGDVFHLGLETQIWQTPKSCGVYILMFPHSRCPFRDIPQIFKSHQFATSIEPAFRERHDPALVVAFFAAF